jgi:type I restriction enzyme, S subunit
MASVFPEVPIEQLCSKVTTGATPLRSRSDFYEGGTIDWYKTGELKDWYLDAAEERITEKAFEETSVKLFPANTVLMAMYGDGKTITSLGMLRASAATNQACSAMLVDERKCDTRYFFYALKARRHLLLKVASGGAQRNLSGKLIKEFKLPAPSIPVQQRIAGILSAYDELIENSQRRIRLLEAMARALYREWFVHFRFPGHEKLPRIASPLGNIPHGWGVKKLKDVCHLTMGQSPKSEFYNERGEGQPFHQGVTNFGERFPTDRLFCTAEGRVAEAGDILFSVRAPVGRMNIVNRKIIIGRGLSAIRHKEGHQAFLWEQLRNRFTEDDMMGNGAIFAAVTKDDMQSIELVCPPPPLVVAATRHFEPIHTELDALSKKISNLCKTRDLLLPRLLSGQVSFGER